MTSGDTDTIPNGDAAEGSHQGAAPPADGAQAEVVTPQAIDARLRSAIADQLTAMEQARATVAQAAALLLQPIAAPRLRPFHHPAAHRTTVEEIRRTLCELREII